MKRIFYLGIHEFNHNFREILQIPRHAAGGGPRRLAEDPDEQQAKDRGHEERIQMKGPKAFTNVKRREVMLNVFGACWGITCTHSALTDESNVKGNTSQ